MENHDWAEGTVGRGQNPPLYCALAYLGQWLPILCQTKRTQGKELSLDPHRREPIGNRKNRPGLVHLDSGSTERSRALTKMMAAE